MTGLSGPAPDAVADDRPAPHACVDVRLTRVRGGMFTVDCRDCHDASSLLWSDQALSWRTVHLTMGR